MSAPWRMCIAMVLVGATSASRLPDVLALRGGALTREEIVAKLNRVPTFAIVDGEERVLPITTESGADICWFTDAAEAQELLELTKAANPDVAVHLAVTPLGEAFIKCNGWPDAEDGEEAEGASYVAGKLKIRGTRKVVDANAEALQQQQRAQGITPGAWVLPVYCHDDFQTPQMMPLFFSAADLQAGWLRSGRAADAVPENLPVMELRVLVKQMAETDVFDWKIFTFVSSEAAYALAQELITSRKEEQGDGEAEEDETDDDEVLD